MTRRHSLRVAVPRLPASILVPAPARFRLPLAATLLALSAGCSSDTGSPVPPGGTDTGKDSGGDTDTGEDSGTVPTPTGPWLRTEVASPGSITFTELMYHPAVDEDLEWIELHNPMAIDMDLSGWALAGGIDFTFAEGTILAPDGYLVVAADPSRVPGALGPYAGRLSNDGERIDLMNNGGRRIDSVGFADDDPWTPKADGSGFTLAKADPDAASDHAENWTVSTELGGTPGAANRLDPHAPPTKVELVALDATWAYDTSGAYPDADWAAATYDDSAWARADAIFFAGASAADVLATASATADNYYAIYLGKADGSDLRLVGADVDGDWTTVDDFALEVGPEDHLYLAAWEAPWDYGGPQMTIAEVELPDDVVGTDATRFEWVLGPSGDCPGTPAPPPTAEAIRAVVEDAEAAGDWALPAVEADRSSSPWGWALGGAFDSATQYVWPDTFSDTSVTNTENTYALFRSVDPLQGPRGTTELDTIQTTTTFRTPFTLDADPAATELSLECVVDDGAVVYLNGVEVLRHNVPAGALSAKTRATAAVDGAESVYASLPTTSLVRGQNVLAVELHQAASPDDDLTFGCALTARISAASDAPSLVLNEVAAGATSPFWVELRDVGAGSLDLDGLVLRSSEGGEYVFPAATLAPDDLLAVDDVGFPVAAGDVLYLYSADRASLLDAVRVRDGVRARADDGGDWRVPREATPGAANVIDQTDAVVINEIQYHHAPRSVEGDPVTDVPEEWIELYNRGAEPVDLGGWAFSDAVTYTFPSGTILAPGGYLVVAGDAGALQEAHPDIPVIGDLVGHLDNGGDHVVLLDARGNPADEVRYYDGGRWPESADGGGSTLELMDADADNDAPEAWAPSAEWTRSSWVSYDYRGTADPSAVGPDGAWEELVLGLLDAGEVLVDDVSVIQDPDSAAVQLVQNGTFSADEDHWRLLGSHRHSAIVPDPDDGANPVLRLVATGPTGHMHNHAETTLARPIGTREYEVSFRARWISGSNQLNSRLYFNRLPHTTLVTQPELSGTPGAANSTAVDNLGPTFADLHQDLAVPAPGEPVQVTVDAADPDGVASVTLWTSVDGGAFAETPMTEVDSGTWSAAIDGAAAGSIVQLYVEAVDGAGAHADFPADGPDSRALYKVDGGEAATNGLHNFRIVMTDADSDWLHDDVNLMSDEGVRATVIYEESQVFYDVDVRAKGSERGRPEQPRLGYGVSFHADQPFRGSHCSVLLDRSEGVGYGQREVLMNLVMTHGGSPYGEYNDLTQAITPLPQHTGAAELQLDRFSSLVLDAQFEDGASGPLYEYELVYYPLTTDDGTAEGLKLPAPDSVVGTYITDLGDDKEAYRWDFLIQNNERRDDYTRLIDLGKTFALDQTDLLAQAEATIDVDEWLRAYAFATLSGAVDNYGGDGSQHNARFYVRPSDGKVLYFPHDLDFYGGYSMAVIGNGDLSRLLQDPANQRAYYGHLQDIIERAYNAEYLGPWCDQLGDLLVGQNFASHCQFVADRADWVMYSSPDAVMAEFPPMDFQITTGGGADTSVAAKEITLRGDAWVDVHDITLDGAVAPLEITWVDAHTWEVTVPLVDGANDVTLVATDLHGDVVGTDALGVTSTGG